MRLVWKLRSVWGTNYDVYDEYGNKIFFVKNLSTRHGVKWRVCDCNGNGIGKIREVFFSNKRYDIYVGGNYIGEIKRDNSIWQKEARFSLPRHGWHGFKSGSQGVRVWNQAGLLIMTASNWKSIRSTWDEGSIDVVYPEHKLLAVMIVLAAMDMY